MNSILKIIVLSELKFSVIILFILAFITIMAGQGTRKSHVRNTYSADVESLRNTGNFSNESTLHAGGSEASEEQNDSTVTFENNQIQIMSTSIKSEWKEDKNLTSVHNSPYVLYYSLSQYSIISLFQREYYAIK